MLKVWSALLFSLATTRFAGAQTNLEWARCYNGPDNGWDTGLAVTVDDSGYVYVTGASPGASATSATIKYSPTGSQLWLRRFTSTGADLTLDHARHLYITGRVTIKINQDGDTLWTREWPPFSGAQRIAISMSGNIYLGGSLLFDYGIEKLASDGEVLWTRTYNGPANATDRINDMVLDSQGNVIVTGQSRGVGTDWDYATVKYSSDGDTLWIMRYSGPGPPQEANSDFAHAIAVDNADNIYVTGWSKSSAGIPQCFTIKYSYDGDSLWGHRFPSSGTVGYAGYDIVFDRGFIYVVARAHGFNDTLLKYDLNGNLVWSRPFVSNTFAGNNPKLAVDTAGNIYHTSVNSVGRSDFIVLKYSPDGERLWTFAYPDSGSNTGNNVYAIAVDKSGNVYLTGESSGWVCPGANYDYLTLKISQSPTSVGNGRDLPGQYELRQNYPNPFNPSTTMEFSLPTRSFVSLKVFDLLGREIAIIVSEELPAGKYSRQWSADGFPSGIYFYRIQAGEFSQTKKLIRLR